jgi:pyruvate dehydrogenase E1 component alpha subunit
MTPSANSSTSKAKPRGASDDAANAVPANQGRNAPASNVSHAGDMDFGRNQGRGQVKGGPASKLGTDELLSIYRMMLLIRRFEEQVIELFQEGVLPGFLHVAIGQEAIAAGTGAALRPEDYIGSTHRAHGHVLAKGSSSAGMMAELMGRVTGYCRGKGGSMHVADLSHNVVGANGVVGAGAPMMTGVALTLQQRGEGGVAVAFYGDGATNQGNVHEAMNLAQLWHLPVIFVCENNGYAESTPYWQHAPVADLASRGLAYDMKTISVDGNDPLAVYDAIAEAREHAESGAGPVYVVAETRRIVGHYIGDAEVYRAKGEAKEWRKGDPIPRFEAELTKRKVAKAKLEEAAASVEQEIEAAVAAARAADFPAPEEALLHVYSGDEPYPGPVLL